MVLREYAIPIYKAYIAYIQSSCATASLFPFNCISILLAQFQPSTKLHPKLHTHPEHPAAHPSQLNLRLFTLRGGARSSLTPILLINQFMELRIPRIILIHMSISRAWRRIHRSLSLLESARWCLRRIPFVSACASVYWGGGGRVCFGFFAILKEWGCRLALAGERVDGCLFGASGREGDFQFLVPGKGVLGWVCTFGCGFGGCHDFGVNGSPVDENRTASFEYDMKYKKDFRSFCAENGNRKVL